MLKGTHGFRKNWQFWYERRKDRQKSYKKLKRQFKQYFRAMLVIIQTSNTEAQTTDMYDVISF